MRLEICCRALWIAERVLTPPLFVRAMLKVVLFDMDNTLIDRNAAFEACVREMFSDPALRREIIDVDAGGIGERAAVFELWEKLGGQRINQSVLGQMISERIRPDPGLLHVLQDISRSVGVGIISNGSGETQRRKLRGAGLDAVFGKHVWISEEVGSAKPDVRIFKKAMQTLGVRPKACLYIGDRDEIDLRGAHAAGMRARIVNGVLSGPRLSELFDEEAVR